MQIFKNPELDFQVKKDGFVVLPIFGKEQQWKLKAVYENIRPKGVRGFYTTYYLIDLEPKKYIFEKIDNEIKGFVKRTLIDYSLLSANYVVKESHDKKTVVPLHQDWSFVDEKKFVSLSVWCPLIDAGASEGGLAVVPGSHRLTCHIRTRHDKGPLSEVFRVLEREHSIQLKIKAGHGVLFDTRLVHGSPMPNSGGLRRIAVNCVLRPKKAALFHSIGIAPNKIETFRVDEAFFLGVFPGMSMKKEWSIGVQDYPSTKLTQRHVRNWSLHV
jgi:hypothetical protein